MTILSPKFRNKSGSLTPYAFACGYIETSPEGVELSKDGCWHVKFCDEKTGLRLWETASLLSEARRIFRSMRSKVKSL